jgi:gamma-glutamylputrescine oxidase
MPATSDRRVPGAGTAAEAVVAVSPWLLDADPPRPSLHGDVEADVAVVGGGYTGLSAALALRAEGRRVVLLDAHFCGFGASGRNAGHLTPTIGKDLPTLLRVFGRARAAEFVALADASVGEVERLLREHRIECAYEAVGNVIAAVHPRQFRTIDRAAEAALSFGLPGEFLDGQTMQRRGLPRGFLRGYHERHGGILDPGRYVKGLRRAALEAGVQIHERSPVLAIEDGDRPVVRTREGSVRAELLVLGVNAYAGDLRLPSPLPSRLMPVHVQLLQTAPLTPEQLARVGWQGREGVYTAHEVLESWRLTEDNRLLGGSKFVRYGYDGSLLPDRDASVTIRLESTLRRRFPELAEVEVSSVWGGRIGIALDFLPAIGRTGTSGRILYSMSYAGHGLAMATLAGRMLADLASGREGPGSVLWKRRGVPIPPEPLRWLVFRVLTGCLKAIDRRVDRLID